VSAGWRGSPESGPLTYAPPGLVSDGLHRPAIFLDRDGTINGLIADPDSGLPESPLQVADVRLIAGAASAIEQLCDAGYVIVCVTNQPAAAKGFATLRGLLDVHERVLELLAAQGARIDLSQLCPHHPGGAEVPLARACDCRKPAPGMLLRAATELGLDLGRSWIVGDTDADVGAGRAAGCRTALVGYPPSAHKREAGPAPDISAPDITTAIAALLEG
jgi:D-glycero-D-manno-heptose 1,7-bisphosphate phosphatase